MKPSEILEIVAELEQYLPVVKHIIPLISQAGADIKPLMDALADYSVDTQMRMIDRYIKAGCTREEALLLVLNSKISLSKMLSNSNGNK